MKTENADEAVHVTPSGWGRALETVNTNELSELEATHVMSALTRRGSMVIFQSAISKALSQVSLVDEANMFSEFHPRNCHKIFLQFFRGIQRTCRGPTALSILTSGSLLAYHFVSKLTFGDREPDDRPNKFLLIALARLLLLSLIGGGALYKVGRRDLQSQMSSIKIWAVGVPYAVGLIGVVSLAFVIVQYISAASRNAIMQSRLLLDLLFGWYLLEQPVTDVQVMLLVTLILAIVVHADSNSTGSVNKDPALGIQLQMCHNLIASSTNVWIPVSKRWVKCEDLTMMLVTSAEIFVISLAASFCTSGSKIMHGLQFQDVGLICLIFITDVLYFLVPIFMNPLSLTLCVTANIPTLYLIEGAYFGTGYEFLPLSSVIVVAGLACTYFMYKASIKKVNEEYVQTDDLQTGDVPSTQKQPARKEQDAQTEEVVMSMQMSDGHPLIRSEEKIKAADGLPKKYAL